MMNLKIFLKDFFLGIMIIFIIITTGCTSTLQGPPEINTTSTMSSLQHGDDFPVLVQINGSVQRFLYSEFRQQNYAMIPILYNREDSVFLYSVKSEACWDENISTTMAIFFNDLAIKSQLSNGSVIIGLDYYIREHCVRPVCLPCEAEGPVLELQAFNRTEWYRLDDISTGAPVIKHLQ
jgi:hypothetical protein